MIPPNPVATAGPAGADSPRTPTEMVEWAGAIQLLIRDPTDFRQETAVARHSGEPGRIFTYAAICTIVLG